MWFPQRQFLTWESTTTRGWSYRELKPMNWTTIVQIWKRGRSLKPHSILVPYFKCAIILCSVSKAIIKHQYFDGVNLTNKDSTIVDGGSVNSVSLSASCYQSGRCRVAWFIILGSSNQSGHQKHHDCPSKRPSVGARRMCQCWPIGPEDPKSENGCWNISIHGPMTWMLWRQPPF